ncbi:hypothetical protein Smic_47250 [Streptomyces microflavus]|uniref:Uncharacterized protein n=1 Tax=Streptomyces microflavus TaxID=1919 RepID=A0A7J0CV77_STRMI|nr:hypothetical protein Smic_47250 [Streptomyces microflavus]
MRALRLLSVSWLKRRPAPAPRHGSASGRDVRLSGPQEGRGGVPVPGGGHTDEARIQGIRASSFSSGDRI